MILTREVLSDKLAKDMEYSKSAMNKIVLALYAEIADALRKGDTVVLTNIGRISSKVLKARMGINPRNREPVQLPTRVSFKLTPCRSLKQAVNPPV